MNPLVSVIVPAYNAEETIVECLESVHQQTYNNIEIIVVDDGSLDNTYSTIKEYQFVNDVKKLKVFQIDNSGPAYARNYGIRYASGEYIAFLDSDDKWEPNKMARQIDILKQNHEIDLLGCGYIVGKKSHFSAGKIKYISKYKLLFKNYFLTPCVILKRDILKELTFITSRKYSEDYYLWLQIAFHNYKCAILEEPLTILYDKPTFGGKGLSANLWKMEKGELNNFYMLYKQNLISLQWYVLGILCSFIKFFKRLIISIVRNLYVL